MLQLLTHIIVIIMINLFNILSRRQSIVLSVVSFLRIYCWNNDCKFVSTNLLLVNITMHSKEIISVDS